MQTLQKAGAWLKAHIPAVIIAVVFVLPALVMLMPFYYHTFKLHMLVQAVALIMQGIVSWIMLPYTATPALYILLMSGFWLVVGFIVYWLWQRGLGERAIIFLIFLINTLFFGVNSAMSAISTASETPVVCENFVSEETGVQIVSYPRILNSHNFFLVTQNGGETWSQFKYQLYRGVLPSCDNLEARDDSFFWLWDRQTLMITQDGGETWQTYEIADTWEGWEPTYRNWEIAGVRFENRTEGELLLRWAGPDLEKSLVLETEDGGETWHMQADDG